MTKPSRIAIENGCLVNLVDAAVLAECWDAVGGDTMYWTEIPLFEKNGEPVKGSYRGLGFIVEESGKKIVMLGDGTQSFIPEYVLAEKATDESLAALDAFVAGFKAGATEGKGKRRNVPREWIDGYARGLRYRCARIA